MPNLTKLKQLFTVLILGLLSLVLLITIIIAIVRYEQNRPQYCNVAVVNLTGSLVVSTDPSNTTEQQTTSDQVDRQLETAKNDPRIKAVVLSVDSVGGDGVAGEDIQKELESISKPTVVIARSVDDSAAYEASIGADTIFASAESFVGDVGATASYVDNSKQDVTNGLTFNQLSAGRYKDMMNPDKPLTADEKALEMSLVNKDYVLFVQMIANNRHMSYATAEALANGSQYIGIDALKNGLIDRLGDMLDVQQYLAQKLGKKVVLCQQ